MIERIKIKNCCILFCKDKGRNARIKKLITKKDEAQELVLEEGWAAEEGEEGLCKGDAWLA